MTSGDIINVYRTDIDSFVATGNEQTLSAKEEEYVRPPANTILLPTEAAARPQRATLKLPPSSAKVLSTRSTPMITMIRKHLHIKP